ncbi:hypothetical protein [Ktedonospora formicarum]|nr:hypothetical protein [Ktedonospora formicarum]
MWTIWGTDPDTNQKIWYWHPPIVPTQEDAEQLEAEKWISIDPEQQHTLFLTLLGQLAEIKYVQNDSDDSVEAWVQQEDLAYASSTPVVLAFYLPEHLQSMETSSPIPTQQEESGELPSMPLLVGDTLASVQFGEVALVADSTAGGWRPYRLQQLGEEGLAIQQQMLREITQLEVDARTSRSHKRFKKRLLKSYQLAVRQERYLKLHQLTQKLAELYWKSYQGLAPRPSTALPIRTLPETPYVVGKGTIIPAPQPVQAVLAAYSNAQAGAEGWNTVKSVPTFVYNKENGTTHVEFRPSDPSTQLDNATIQSLWSQVRQLSDIDGDVLIAMLAQAIAAPHDEKDGVWITGKLILDYRGISPIMKREEGKLRRAGHRQEDLADVASCVSRMSNTWIRVEQWIEDDRERPGRRSRTKKEPKTYLYTRESRLINVTDIIRQHELQAGSGKSISEQSPQNSIAIAWRYQVGSWVEPFLQGANRQVAWLLQQVLSYDPYHETWEKRLARYFTFHMRINAAKGGVTIEREVGKLIEELTLPINQRDPDRTRKRFEKAMDRLEADLLVSQWGYVQDNPPLPKRKWLPTWLQYRLWITAAPALPNQYLPEAN